MSEAAEVPQNPPATNGHQEAEEAAAPAPPAKALPSGDAPEAPAPEEKETPAETAAPASETEEKKMEVDAVDGAAEAEVEAPKEEEEPPKEEEAPKEEAKAKSEEPAEAEEEKEVEKVEEKKEEVSSSPEKKEEEAATATPTNTQETSSPKKGRSPKKTKTPTPTTTPTRSPRKAASGSPAKTPAKDTSSSAESAPKTPVLEQPLTTEGKRQRRSVERWTEERTQTIKEFTIPEGSGTKLGDIEYVEAMISKTPSEVLKTLHRLCFGVVGKNTMVKKHLRQFNGYAFKDGSEEAKRKIKSLESMQQKGLKQVCEKLGLERSKTKEEMVKSIFAFLLSPVDSGKKVPAKRGKKRRSSTAKKGGKKGGKKEKGKKDESGDEGSEDGSESESGDEEEEEEQEQPPPKKAKAETSGKGRGRPKKDAGPKPPSDTELKSAIKKLLKGVNLESVTMKEMCKKVYDHFPGVDLAPRKDFIKSSVKEGKRARVLKGNPASKKSQKAGSKFRASK